MTTMMNQVTCSLCKIEVDDSEWTEYINSTNHLQNSKSYKDEVAVIFLFYFYHITYQSRSELDDLKIKKTYDFWEAYFSTKVPKEKFDKF